MRLLFNRFRSPGAWAFILLVAGVPLLALSWAAASNSGGGSLPAAGGRYVEGDIGPAPERINPLFAANTGPEADLAGLIFSGLTRTGPNGESQPDLAEDWVASIDGTSFTFDLRQDVLWQDGQPFTADDVLFTAQTFAAPGVKGDPATAEVWRRARVDKIGLYTVVFQFSSSFAPFLAYSSAGILPQHLLGKDSPEQLVSDQFNRHPVGTGPYRLQSLTASGAELARYTAYHLGTPYLDHISMRFLKDNQTLIGALRSHQVDGGILPPPLASSQLDSLRGTGHRLISGGRPAYSLVYLNLNIAQFQDVAVRQALSLATDRNGLVQQVMDGQATAADVPLPPGTWTSAGSPPNGGQSAARQALQKAGWALDANGVQQRQGISLSFTLQTTDDPQRRATADALARGWAAIGVKANVQTVDEATLLSNILLPHKYEAVLYGWDPGPDPDPFPAWHSSQKEQQGSNLSGYSSARADQLLEAARQTADPVDRAQIYGSFADVFRQDVPAVVLFFPRFVYVLPQRLTGVRLGLLYSPTDRFSGVEAWSMETRRY